MPCNEPSQIDSDWRHVVTAPVGHVIRVSSEQGGGGHIRIKYHQAGFDRHLSGPSKSTITTRKVLCLWIYNYWAWGQCDAQN